MTPPDWLPPPICPRCGNAGERLPPPRGGAICGRCGVYVELPAGHPSRAALAGNEIRGESTPTRHTAYIDCGPSFKSHLYQFQFTPFTATEPTRTKP